MSIDTASNLDGHVSNDLIPQLNSTNYKKYKKITYFFCFVFNFYIFFNYSYNYIQYYFVLVLY